MASDIGSSSDDCSESGFDEFDAPAEGADEVDVVGAEPEPAPDAAPSGPEGVPSSPAEGDEPGEGAIEGDEPGDPDDGDEPGDPDDGDEPSAAEQLAAEHRGDLADGTYSVRVSNSSSAVLDVRGGSLSAGAQVNLWSRKSTGDNQLWEATHDESGFVRLESVTSGHVLGVASAAQGAKLAQLEDTGDLSQRWVAVREGSSYKLVCAADPSLVLDAQGGKTSDGTRAELYADNGGANQRWALSATEPLLERLDALAAANRSALPDGTYALRPSHASGKALDVQGASSSSGANANLWSYGGRSNQAWRVTHDADGYVTLTNVLSGKALDSSGSNVKQRDPDPSSRSQKWVAVRGGSSYRLVPATDDALSLDVRRAASSDGAQTILYADSGAANQRWAATALSEARAALNDLAHEHAGDLADGTYYVRVSNSSASVLDVQGASSANSANVNLWRKSSSANQAWRVTHDSYGYVTLTNVASGKALDVRGADASAGARVVQYAGNGGWNQKWVAVRDGSAYKLVSAMDGGLVLDARRASTANGTWTELYSDNGGANQRWAFEAYDYSRTQLLSRLDSMSSSSGLTAFGTSYSFTSSAGKRLKSAVNSIRASYSLGFVMMDLKTGVGVCSSPSRSFYVASSLKGPYVVAINKYNSGSVTSYWKDVMESTITVSSNEGYSALRNRFGSSPMASFMSYTGVSGRWSAASSYPYVTARDLAKLWVGNYWYFHKETNKNSSWCRSIFTHSLNSPIYNALRGKYTTYSKPGWYPMSPYWVQNDAGVVMAGDHPYLIVILSSACGQYSKLQTLVRALDAVHTEMV